MGERWYAVVLLTLLSVTRAQFIPPGPANRYGYLWLNPYAGVSAPGMPFAPAAQPFGARSPTACAVSNLQMEPNLNLRNFMGQWYFIDDIGLSTMDKLNPLARPLDVKAFFTLNADGTVTVYTTGRRGISTTCRNQIGLGRLSGTDSAKLLLSFPNAQTAEERTASPYWIAWTDYQSALVYSCRRMLPDGTCDPSATFSWTLSRDPCGHSPSAECAIVQRRMELCLPARFRPMNKVFSCPRINPYTFVESTPGAMALPGSPLYNPEVLNPNRPVQGPERYVCRVAGSNPIPNPACPMLRVPGGMNGFTQFMGPSFNGAYNPVPALRFQPNPRGPFLSYGINPGFRKKK